MVRFHPGSLHTQWSVGAMAARVLGKDEARVRLPNGPLHVWAHGPKGRLQLGRLAIRVRFPVGPLDNGRYPNWLRKLRAKQSPRLAGFGVRFPALPLARLDGETEIMPRF